MIRRLFGLATAVALAAAFATPAQAWTPTVDTYGSSRAQYLSRDMADCQALAERASGAGTGQARQAAVSRGLVGAASGAALGAALGGNRGRAAGRGAAAGATLGALSGGLGTASETDAAFQRAFRNCLRDRGHNVIN